MAFEDLFVALRDDQFGQLRCEKTLQSADPPQLLDLLSDPRLQASVQFRHLVSARAQLAQEPCVLDRDDRLRCEVLQQRDLLVGEPANFAAPNRYCAQQNVVLSQRDGELSAGTSEFE
jgi:hypothetical protein